MTNKLKSCPRNRSVIHYYAAAIWKWALRYWRKNWFHKALASLLLLAGLSVAGMYGIARWYIASEAAQPLRLGVSFVPDYARSLGLDPQQTMDAIIRGLGVRRFRLVGYWSDIERVPGRYDFSELDWEFRKAEAAHAKVSLSLGLRQPRWPECHAPAWADTSRPESQWYPQLRAFIGAVVARYKNSPALDSYQLENEYFLKSFGQCTDYSRSRLADEFYYVQSLDPAHPIIMGRSGNALGIPLNAPTPDEFGVSVYKRVWDITITHRYIEYPIPAWYYGFLAGAEKLINGRGTIIDELQAEPWPPHGKTLTQISLAEQDKSMDAQRMKDRFEYGRATGMRAIDLWGAEWWYWRKVKAGDPSVWNAAKNAFQQAGLDDRN